MLSSSRSISSSFISIGSEATTSIISIVFAVIVLTSLAFYSFRRTQSLPLLVLTSLVLDFAGFGDVVPEFLHVPGGGGAAFGVTASDPSNSRVYGFDVRRRRLRCDSPRVDKLSSMESDCTGIGVFDTCSAAMPRDVLLRGLSPQLPRSRGRRQDLPHNRRRIQCQPGTLIQPQDEIDSSFSG